MNLPTTMNINNEKADLENQGALPVNQASKIKSRWLIVVVIFITTIAILGLAIWLFIDNKDTKNLLVDSRNAFLKGDLEESTKKLVNAKKQNPNDAYTTATLIRSIANSGSFNGNEKESFDKAKPEIDEALSKFPNNSLIFSSVGYAYETAGYYNEALDYYERSLKLDSEDADTLFHKGHVLEFLGKQSEAYSVYNSAYELDNKNPFIIMAKAKVLLFQGSSEEAIELYKTVGDLPNASVSEKAEAYTNISVLLRTNIFRTVEAMEYAEKAIQINPNYSPGVGNYGFLKGVYYQDFELGKSNLEKAIELNPRISQNYWFLASLYRVNKKYPEAIKFQKLAVDKLNDDNTIISVEEKNKRKAAYLYDLASIYSLAGNSEDILIPLKEAIKLDASLKEAAKKAIEDKALFMSISDNEEFTTLLK